MEGGGARFRATLSLVIISVREQCVSLATSTNSLSFIYYRAGDFYYDGLFFPDLNK